jgi:hypothetical protein
MDVEWSSCRARPENETPYGPEIMAYVAQKEMHFQAREPMARQLDLNKNMRALLLDWLVDVHLRFKLVPDTLFLAVNLIDRYLAR